MGSAQPLAVKMAGGVCIAVEVDRAKAERRCEAGYCDAVVEDLPEAIRLARASTDKGEPFSLALIGNAAEVHEELLERGFGAGDGYRSNFRPRSPKWVCAGGVYAGRGNRASHPGSGSLYEREY